MPELEVIILLEYLKKLETAGKSSAIPEIILPGILTPGKFFVIGVILTLIIAMVFVGVSVFAGFEEEFVQQDPITFESSSPVDDSSHIDIPVLNNMEETCPVCKKVIDPSSAEFRHISRDSGNILYFDSEKCYKAFLDGPDKYLGMKPEIKVKVKIKKTIPTPTPSGESILKEPTSTFNLDQTPLASPVPDSPATSPGETDESAEKEGETPTGAASPGESDAFPPSAEIPPGSLAPPLGKLPPGVAGTPSPGAETKSTPPGSFDFDIPPGAIPQRRQKGDINLESTPIAPPPGMQKTF